MRPLTKREIEVVSLMMTGITDADIAKTLGISINTTKAHLGNIYAKLGAISRVDAAVKAKDLGYSPTPVAA